MTLQFSWRSAQSEQDFINSAASSTGMFDWPPKARDTETANLRFSPDFTAEDAEFAELTANIAFDLSVAPHRAVKTKERFPR
jgi:hypothetical protein